MQIFINLPAAPTTFRETYERLALEGKCDSPGGCEYRRVLAEWRSAGCPANIEEFIVKAPQ